MTTFEVHFIGDIAGPVKVRAKGFDSDNQGFIVFHDGDARVAAFNRSQVLQIAAVEPLPLDASDDMRGVSKEHGSLCSRCRKSDDLCGFHRGVEQGYRFAVDRLRAAAPRARA